MNDLLECGGCLWYSSICAGRREGWGSLSGDGMLAASEPEPGHGRGADGSMTWAWPGATVAAADQARGADRGQASAPMERRGGERAIWDAGLSFLRPAYSGWIQGAWGLELGGPGGGGWAGSSGHEEAVEEDHSRFEKRLERVPAAGLNIFHVVRSLFPIIVWLGCETRKRDGEHRGLRGRQQIPATVFYASDFCICAIVFE